MINFGSEIFLKENERIDDLNFDGYRIIQDRNKFCFGIDSVILANFVQVRQNDFLIDLGCGNGVICLLLAAKKNPAKIVGLEIQEECVDIAKRNVLLNGLSDKVEIICGDLKNVADIVKRKFDTVVTNPPYINSGMINENESKAVARHEILCNLEDVIYNSSAILRPKGKFFMVHRSNRLTDVLCMMRKYDIEPRRLKFVHTYVDSPAQMILIEGVKSSNNMLEIEKPLVIYDSGKKYTQQINEIYGVDKNKL